MNRLRLPRRVVFLLSLISMASIGWSAEGLTARIDSVVINADLKPEIFFTLQNAEGAPVEAATSAGGASVRFIIARLDVLDAARGSAVYTSYNARIVSATEGSPNAGKTAEQATYDTYDAKRLTGLAPGKYKYLFNTALPADYDRTKTHTVSAQIERTVNGVRYVANPLYHFVPNGNPVTALRKVVTTEGCNKCHTNLGLHGGARMEVGLCILCHSPQSSDPETGNSVDMTEMIHKIHMGANLPSVEGGAPYEIIGNRGSTADFSEVEFPTDLRNCAICHTGEQGGVYKTAPSRRACGACHDGVNFETGVGHGPGLPQADDSLCAACHQPNGAEYGISIAGAHTVPYKSAKLKGIVAAITQVTNALPGQNPVVRLTLKQKDGTTIDPTTLSTVAITFGGPSQEYASYVREDGTKTLVADGDVYLYTFKAPIPAGAQGTYMFSVEARRTVVLVDNPEGETDVTVTEAADNPIYYVAVTGTQITQRRKIVDQNKCNDCHDRVALHGSLRSNIEYCVVCHNPKVSDIGRRGEGVGGGSSISMGYMIHKIHTGEELSQPYTIYGYGNSANDFTKVLFPGNRRVCSTCHIADAPALPLAAEAAAINFTDKDGKQVLIPPATASCTSCHDSAEVAEHVSQYNQGSEVCFACHGAGQTADIALYHRLDRVLNVVEVKGSPGTAVPDWSIFN